MANIFTESILRHAEAAGTPISADQADLCRIHIELMLEWNRHLNLTRITRQEDIVIKHLLDSILPAASLPASGRALDVGTGAGFPGIPLKIFHPDLEITLLDSSRKKASFLAVTVAKLGLKGAHSLHGNWEDFSAAAENQNSLQLITMRAVRLELSLLSRLASKTLKPGGVFAWWAGPESELTEGDLFHRDIAGLTSREKIFYRLPGISRQRSVWIWRKSGAPE